MSVALGVGGAIFRRKETPLEETAAGGRSKGCCAPVMDVVRAVKGSPRLLYHLAAVQCLVWIGNTSWNLYSGQCCDVQVLLALRSAAPILFEGLFEAMLARRSKGLDSGSPGPDFWASGPGPGTKIINSSNLERR